jgi:type IV pilus assembly protein PilY1
MSQSKTTLQHIAQASLVFASLLAAIASSAITLPAAPLSVQASAKPMIMLAFGRDHRLFYEAYNDSSDINGDGQIDIRFNPSITYLGLFDANYCYTHSAGASGSASNTGMFRPAGLAQGTLRTCPNSSAEWSGNWLNYQTTSRVDALRVVLYGGLREIDTSSSTVLRRSYIPQDAHSWGKEYTSQAVDGYRISDYTPLAQPTTNTRHLFGNLTANAGVDCGTLSNCSNLPPWLSVVPNSTYRIWDWASKERPVLGATYGPAANDTTKPVVNRSNYTVRVESCTPTYNRGCKQYSQGGVSNYKPVGLLHDFGENESALFGLISGSYDSHLSGGRLRKAVSSFKDEVDQDTGVFKTVTDGIVRNLNSFRIYGFNRNRVDNIYEGNVVGSGTATEGQFPDWGNPLGELMYEATRYFANKGAATSVFTGSTTIDDTMGLSKPAWDRPYKQDNLPSTAKAPWCARANILAISDTNTSFDSDQLPGVNTNFGTGIANTDLLGKNIVSGGSGSLRVADVADFITSNEPGIAGSRFIGQSGGIFDSAPTPKVVSSLSSIRGLAPEEPTKRGSYYPASVAHFSKTSDLNSSLQGNQSIDNYFVALASPLLRIEAKLPNGNVISLLPFAKSVGGAFGITNGKNAFQPTNQIVDYFVEYVKEATATQLYEAKFRINFEDVEQGNDHDMDAIVEYTVKARIDNTLEVIVKPLYQAGGVQHRMGYVLSGTTKDGIYLVVQDEKEFAANGTDSRIPYFLNTPPGRDPGYCDKSTIPADCYRLPYLGRAGDTNPSASLGPTTDTSARTFSPATTTNRAEYLKDPMWYAAKWGNFEDANKNGKPDIQAEWDKDGDGTPDAYLLVQNPLKLREQLTKAFNAIIERKGSASNVSANSGQLNTSSQIYQATFVAGKWSGDITAYPLTASGIGSNPVWSAKANMPVWSNRNIYLNSSANTLVNLRTTSFTSLPTPEQTEFQSENIFNYVRGDTSREVSKGAGNYRDRDGILGDIIHSSPNLDPETGNLYVGANDGMLHAFNSTTGAEKFAVIPQQVVPRLKNLSNTTYTANHEYFVDGDVSLGFKLDQTNLQKNLYVLLGRGGKGLFSINAGTGTVPKFLWEYTPGASTVAAADQDLGLMLSRPVYAAMNNGKGALLVGNGYNSTSGKAALYIFVLEKDGSLAGPGSVIKLDTGVASDNGLSGPAFTDVNGDGTADTIYAGDIKGNLWKFDVSSTDATQWGVAYSGTPLFKAINGSGKAQPITAPVYAAFERTGSTGSTGRVFLFFGTGSYLQNGDLTNTDVQSWYGIIDGNTPISGRDSLRERKITRSGTLAGRVVRTFEKASSGDMTGRRGWYIDLDTPNNGERIVTRSTIVQTIVPALMASSLYPINNDPCVPGGDGYLNFISPFTGGAIEQDLIDVDRNNRFGDSDRLGGQSVGSLALGIGVPTAPTFVANSRSSSGSSPSSGSNTDSVWAQLKSGGVDAERYCDGNACKEDNPSQRGCKGSGQAAVGGSDGLASTGLNCANTFRGRVAWREILKD